MDAGVVSHVVTSPPQWVAAESSGGSPEHGAVTNTELGSLPLQEARSAVRWDAGERTAARSQECLRRGQDLFYPKTLKDNEDRANGQKTDCLLLSPTRRFPRKSAGVHVSE